MVSRTRSPRRQPRPLVRPLVCTALAVLLGVLALDAAVPPPATGRAPLKAVHETAATTTVRAPAGIRTTRTPGRRAARGLSARGPAAVNRAYWSQWAPNLRTPTGWTGDNRACSAGTPSSTSQVATMRAVNFARRLNGLARIRFSPTLNARAQAAALMMSANRRLDHHPSSSWRCYSRTGAAAAGRSNLALSYPSITSGGLVQLYLDDRGGENTAVAHRRWLLNPFTTTMGNGSTDTSNAMVVVGPSRRRPNPAWTSWPAAGSFPGTMEPDGRWSLSAGDARIRFSRATVRVRQGGRAIRARKLRVANGYGMPTLAWQLPSRINRRGTFRVVVSGITRTGSSKRITHRYTVRLFTPHR